MNPSVPLWSEALPPPYPTFPGGTVRADIAIIGGGFAGLSAAYHLLDRRPGARVVVLEAGRIGAGASGHTTGMLGPGVGQSLVASVRRLGAPRARALYQATLRAVEDVRSLIINERIDCELEMTGQLVIARSSPARTRLATLATTLTELGLPGEALDDAALARVLRLTPVPMESERGPAAVRLPVAGTLHPTKLLAGLADRVTQRGGTILEQVPVVGIAHGRPVTLTLATAGQVVADDVVVATAGYTSQLGILRGRILPVHLQVVVTDPLSADALRVIGWDGREGVLDARRVFNYCRLTADNRIVFGGGAPRYHWRGQPPATAEAAVLHQLAEEVQRTFPATTGIRAVSGWTGQIGYVLDTLPVIERLREYPAVLHVGGWCGHGVALSLASGAWVTRMLCDGVVPEDLPWYRNNPPLVPFEPVRWLAFRAVVGTMVWQDRWEERA